MDVMWVGIEWFSEDTRNAGAVLSLWFVYTYHLLKTFDFKIQRKFKNKTSIQSEIQCILSRELYEKNIILSSR